MLFFSEDAATDECDAGGHDDDFESRSIAVLESGLLRDFLQEIALVI
jgi:hypothetical protein